MQVEELRSTVRDQRTALEMLVQSAGRGQSLEGQLTGLAGNLGKLEATVLVPAAAAQPAGLPPAAAAVAAELGPWLQEPLRRNQVGFEVGMGWEWEWE